jgi:hypothetical protein
MAAGLMTLLDLRSGRKTTSSERSAVCEGPREDCFRRLKNPCPVSDKGSSTLRGLFDPNASTLAHIYCAGVSGMLNLD